MIGTRVIIVLTINQGVLFRTRNFIPDYRYTVNFVDGWNVDEVILLDITRERTAESNIAFDNIIKKLTQSFFIPIAVGGGLRSVDDCLRAFDSGADKVILNSATLENPQLLTKVAGMFGSQSVVVSIDVKRHENGRYEVMKDCGSLGTGLQPETWATDAASLGAGEIMLNSIDKDGSLEGYDNYLNSLVSGAVGIPLLVSGGAGNWQHFVDAVNLGGASGVCTSNVYHFTDTSIKSAKKYMNAQGLKVRL